MISILLYCTTGFFIALATFFAMHEEDKLREYPLIHLALAFLLLIAAWPAVVIYRYCL